MANEISRLHNFITQKTKAQLFDFLTVTVTVMPAVRNISIPAITGLDRP
jgi:hypothetical protein